VLFSFKRFDAENPKPADDLFQTFPNLRFLLPEVVLVENEAGKFLQVNSLGPVYEGRVERFARHAAEAPQRVRRSIPFTLQPDSREAWEDAVGRALAAIEAARVDKVVLSRRQKLTAAHPFSSKDLLVNLIDGTAKGTVFLYRYGDVFFCGCTPELLVRKRGTAVESMCLAGTIGVGADEAERARRADELLNDPKNLNEHAFVVDFLRQVMARNCHDVHIPADPQIKSLQHVQHLCTPVSAQVMEGRSVQNLAGQLHPTPALAGTPVGEALMLIRQIESFNRGFFGGSVGFVDADGNGEFSVAIRSGVFDGEIGWVYAGCGIVAGSQAADEFDEIDMKLQTILSAFDGGVQR
jgi:menaquinone-specific isochorismate synthase